MDSRVVIHLSPDLKLAPTPLDRCEYVGSKVYCYFADFGPPVKTMIGHIENCGSYKGALTLITSGNGDKVTATEIVNTPPSYVQTELYEERRIDPDCVHCGGYGMVKGEECWGCYL